MGRVRVGLVVVMVMVAAGFCLIGGSTGVRRARKALSAAWKMVPDGYNSSQLSADNSNASGNGSNMENETEHHEEEQERFKVASFDFDYVRTNLMIAIWVLFASIAKIVFHSHKRLENLFPESCLLIVIGVVLGVILYFSIEDHNYQLNVRTFFLILLPPIILDAGYFMPSRAFFDNLGTILLYAVVGTLLNTLWLGFSLWGVDQANGFGMDQPLELLHCLVFASLLAAVDPVAVLAVFESVNVNEILHIVVFGESLLNDGISVVLYHMFEGFNEIGLDNIVVIDVVAGIGSFFIIVFGATGIGIVCGIGAGIVSRFTGHTRVMEPLIVAVIGYLSFILAEMFHLSGILSCTFCGITMRKYVEVNISQKSQTTIKYLLKMLASVTETIIFMYLGIAAVSDQHQWNTGFVLLTLVFCLIFRSIGVIIQTALANRVRLVRLNKIDQFIMAYGGLRGAIAFALAVLLDDKIYPQKRLFVTTTIVVVYFTNLIMGSTIKPLVNILKVKLSDNRQPTISEKITMRMMDHLMAGVEDLSGQKGHHLLRERFSHFNNKYLKPIIVGRHHPSQKRGYEIFNVYKRLSMKDAKEMVKNPMSATSVNRMQTHIKRMSSQSDINGSRSPSTIDLSMFDLSYWHYQNEFGSCPSLGQLIPEGYTPNGQFLNGGFNIDKTTGRTSMIKLPNDDGYTVESLESYNPERPRPHVYRRHMLSCASIPRLADINETPDMTQSTKDDAQAKRVSFAAQRSTSAYETQLDSPVQSDEGSAIVFQVGLDEVQCNGMAKQLSPVDERYKAALKKRRVGDEDTHSGVKIQGKADQYELQNYPAKSNNDVEKETQGCVNDAYRADEDVEKEAGNRQCMVCNERIEGATASEDNDAVSKAPYENTTTFFIQDDNKVIYGDENKGNDKDSNMESCQL